MVPSSSTTQKDAPQDNKDLGRKLYEILNPDGIATGPALLIDRLVILLVGCVTLMVWFDVGSALGPEGAYWLTVFDWLTTSLLTLEYFMRLSLVSYDPRFAGVKYRHLRYALSPMAIIDLAAILPAWASLFFALDLGFLRLLRLSRILAVLRLIQPSWHLFCHMNRHRSLREKVFGLLFQRDWSGPLHDTIDAILTCFIGISVFVIALETVPTLSERYEVQFTQVELIIGMVFLVEYILRLVVVVVDPRYAGAIFGRIRYAVTPSALVDLVSLLPLLLLFSGWDLTLLPVLRLLRMVKLTRHSRALALIADVIRQEQTTLRAAVFILLVVTTLAGTAVYFAEHGTQPETFSSIPASMYWAVITLTSIGYGDVYPVTVLGRAMTMVLAVVSVGMVALPAGIIATAFSERLRQENGNASTSPRPTPDRIERFVESLTPWERQRAAALLAEKMTESARPDLAARPPGSA